MPLVGDALCFCSSVPHSCSFPRGSMQQICHGDSWMEYVEATAYCGAA